MTTNVIQRDEQHTVAFYLRPVLHDGIPTNFVWDCAGTTYLSQDLPNPTTLEQQQLPLFCRFNAARQVIDR